MTTHTVNSLGTDRKPASHTRRDRPQAAGRTAGVKPAPELVRTRAYELYQSRCAKGVPGDAATDWTQAERELGAGALEPSISDAVDIKSQARGERLLADLE